MLNRRKFIQKLGYLCSVAPLGLLGKTKPQGIKLTTVKVAGLQYGEMADGTLLPTENLLLKREPHNTYDKNAIAIYRASKKVGYIPKDNARILATLLDNGVMLKAEVRYFDKEKVVWDRLWISIWKMG